MTGPELRAYRRADRMTAKAFAHLIGAGHEATVRRWETGKVPIPPTIEVLLWLLDRLPQEKSRMIAEAKAATQ